MLLHLLTPGEEGWIPAPEGPAQYCRHDAGPVWSDDAEHFPGARYHDNTPAQPVPTAGPCVPALTAACASKGRKAAHLDGPIDCGGQGWFCRIIEESPTWQNPDFDDANFAHCNGTDADERDDDGHCHGSDVDSTCALSYLHSRGHSASARSAHAPSVAQMAGGYGITGSEDMRARSAAAVIGASSGALQTAATIGDT